MLCLSETQLVLNLKAFSLVTVAYSETKQFEAMDKYASYAAHVQMKSDTIFLITFTRTNWLILGQL